MSAGERGLSRGLCVLRYNIEGDRRGRERAVSVLLLSRELPLTFGSQSSQKWTTGGHRYSSSVLLRVRNYDQYYTIGTTTLFFYDYLLTLGDEVRHAIRVHPR